MSIKVYRLLRNNQEEGPFTVEELIQKNLRPFDLIWVDGSSAAWHYPGEIPQFKKYAPLPADESDITQSRHNQAQVSPSVQAAIAVNDNLAAADLRQKPRYKISAAWNRIQTITAVSAVTNNPPETEKKKAVKKNMVISQSEGLPSKSLSWEEAWLDWEKEKKSVNDIAQTVQPSTKGRKVFFKPKKNIEPVLEIKYAEPLDSLKDKYIENILQQRNPKKAVTGKGSEFLLPALALVVIFSIAYWLLNNADMPAIKKAAPQQSIANAPSKNAPVSKDENIVQQTSTSDKDVAAVAESQFDNKVEDRKQITASTSKPSIVVRSNNDDDNKSTTLTTPVTTPVSKQNTQAVLDNIGAAQKAIEDINNKPKAILGKQTQVAADNDKIVANKTVTVQANVATNTSFLPDDTEPVKPKNKVAADYIKVPAAITMTDGIANIKIENVSDVDLDLVVVDVQYFNSANSFRKGETFYLHNLRSGRNVVLKTPKDLASDHAISKVSLISSDAKQVYVVGDN